MALFLVVTLVMLYPLSLKLTTMVPEPTDPLLNVWRMQWTVRAFLSGPQGIAHLFNTNIFYPFPLTLAYSEHFLMMSAQALPFLLLTESHLVGMNVSVLLTFVLSGYGMYLLLSTWTGQRWAGFIGGLLFAFSPQRFGQLNHLELLVTQWLPLALLALHWTLTRPGRRYPVLFILFFNLQALSDFHFTLNLTIACALLSVVYALTGRVRWRRGVWLAAIVSVGVTLLLNWPIWRMYLRFSDVMGAVRTLGEVRIYSAALTDYLTAIPYNFLYGWTFGRWQPGGHQFQPLMPVGSVGGVLALVGLLSLFKRRSPSTQTNPPATSQKSIPIFLLLLTIISLFLSFGLNDEALGPNFVALLQASPYRWLYENVAIFQGIRVPGRYGILVVIGLVGLAGWGLSLFTLPSSISRPKSPITIYHLPFTMFIIALILLESWSAPLIGPEFPTGQGIAPVYHWLRAETPADAVILELPFQGPSEFIYEYYASHHWRRMANGGTGFTPPIYQELRQIFNAFPDPRSVDIIQQLGIDLVILHPAAYPPEAWQQVEAELPRYLPAIQNIRQVGDDFVLHIAPPTCPPDPNLVTVSLTPAELDGLTNAVTVTFHNAGIAAFVADVNQVSHLIFADGAIKNFTEPLVTPAGESQAVTVPLPQGLSPTKVAGAWLATLQREIHGQEPPLRTLPEPTTMPDLQPLGLQFADGPQLLAIGLNPAGATICSHLALALQWANVERGGTAIVQLVDPFGRLVAESTAPLPENVEEVAGRLIPLPGSLPPGQYGLRIRQFDPQGQERWPVTAEGVTIPPDQIPPLPLTLHPLSMPEIEPAPGLARFAEAITLSAGQITTETIAPGDWLDFTLLWQTAQPIPVQLTVFTQLLGPDGQVWGQRDNQPGGGWYSTTLWRPGQPIIDHYAFEISAEAPAGAYRLIAGLYDSQTQERLMTETGADFVEVGSVVVIEQ